MCLQRDLLNELVAQDELNNNQNNLKDLETDQNQNDQSFIQIHQSLSDKNSSSGSQKIDIQQKEQKETKEDKEDSGDYDKMELLNYEDSNITQEEELKAADQQEEFQNSYQQQSIQSSLEKSQKKEQILQQKSEAEKRQQVETSFKENQQQLQEESKFQGDQQESSEKSYSEENLHETSKLSNPLENQQEPSGEQSLNQDQYELSQEADSKQIQHDQSKEYDSKQKQYESSEEQNSKEDQYEQSKQSSHKEKQNDKSQKSYPDENQYQSSEEIKQKESQQDQSKEFEQEQSQDQQSEGFFKKESQLDSSKEQVSLENLQNQLQKSNIKEDNHQSSQNSSLTQNQFESSKRSKLKESKQDSSDESNHTKHENDLSEDQKKQLIQIYNTESQEEKESEFQNLQLNTYQPNKANKSLSSEHFITEQNHNQQIEQNLSESSENFSDFKEAHNSRHTSLKSQTQGENNIDNNIAQQPSQSTMTDLINQNQDIKQQNLVTTQFSTLTTAQEEVLKDKKQIQVPSQGDYFENQLQQNTSNQDLDSDSEGQSKPESKAEKQNQIYENTFPEIKVDTSQIQYSSYSDIQENEDQEQFKQSQQNQQTENQQEKLTSLNTGQTDTEQFTTFKSDEGGDIYQIQLKQTQEDQINENTQEEDKEGNESNNQVNQNDQSETRFLDTRRSSHLYQQISINNSMQSQGTAGNVQKLIHSFEEQYSQNTETPKQNQSEEQTENQSSQKIQDLESEKQYKNQNLQEYLIGNNESSGEYEQIDLDEFQSDYNPNKSDKNCSEQYKEQKEQEDIAFNIQQNNNFSSSQSIQHDQKQQNQPQAYMHQIEYDQMRKQINEHQDQKQRSSLTSRKFENDSDSQQLHKGYNRGQFKHKVIEIRQNANQNQNNLNFKSKISNKGKKQNPYFNKVKNSSQRLSILSDQQMLFKNPKQKKENLSKSYKNPQNVPITYQQFENQIFQGEKIKEDYQNQAIQQKDNFVSTASNFKQPLNQKQNKMANEQQFQQQNLPMTAQSSPRIYGQENQSTPHKVSKLKQNYIKSQSSQRQKTKSEKSSSRFRNIISPIYNANQMQNLYQNNYQIKLNNVAIKKSPYNFQSSQKMLSKFFQVSLRESSQQKSASILLNKFKLVKIFRKNLKPSKKRLTFPEIKKQLGDLI